MSLFKVFDIAGSALSAQSVRMNTTASNMANASSASSSSGATYRARNPVFAPMIMNEFDFGGGEIVGVQVEGVVESDAPLKREYQPHHPMADDEGYVFMPNVNVIEEMANMISASRSYQTSIEVMEASKRMLQQTLRLGQ